MPSVYNNARLEWETLAQAPKHYRYARIGESARRSGLTLKLSWPRTGRAIGGDGGLHLQAARRVRPECGVQPSNGGLGRGDEKLQMPVLSAWADRSLMQCIAVDRQGQNARPPPRAPERLVMMRKAWPILVRAEPTQANLWSAPCSWRWQ